MKQITIDEEGNKKIKFRLCHDLSYNLRNIPKSSINNCHIKDEMCAIQYAYTIWCILHFIIALRKLYPSTPILMLKYNVNGAFKRITLYFTSAIKIIITCGTLAYISLWMTFGGKSSCSLFSLLAEPMADIMNKALNLDRLSTLHKTLSFI